MMRAPPSLTRWISSPSRAMSAERIDGKISLLLAMLRAVPLPRNSNILLRGEPGISRQHADDSLRDYRIIKVLFSAGAAPGFCPFDMLFHRPSAAEISRYDFSRGSCSFASHPNVFAVSFSMPILI